MAESYRKQIRNMASLFSLVCLLNCVFAPFAFIGAMGAVFAARPGRTAGSIMTSTVAVMIAIAIIAFFAARHTKLCRIWPAIVFIVLFGLWGVLCLLAIFGASVGPSGPETLLGPAVGLLFAGAFLYVCIRGMMSIPRFLATPVWCQEALVHAKL
jgi:hypothetical protein